MQPVIYLCPSFPVVSETFVSDQIEALAASGTPVRVIALTQGNATQLFKSWRSNPTRSAALTILYPQISMAVKLKSLLRLKLHLLSRPTSWLPTLKIAAKAPGLALQAAQFAAGLNFKPQTGSVVVCHFGTVGIVGNLLRTWGLLTMPQVTVFHGFDISAIPHLKGSNFYTSLLTAPNHTSLAITNLWQNRLKSMGDTAPAYIPLGVHLENFPFQPRTMPKGRPVRLITVGRLMQKKGQADVLQALAALPQTLSWEYHLVGTGPQEADLRTMTDLLGLTARVHFHGSLPHPETRKRLAESDIFLLPSRTAENGDMEGLPVAIMEALASGMPTISTVHSGIPELITHNHSGLLSDEGDIEALTENIRLLLETPKLWPTLTGNARRKIEAEYNLATNLATFREFIMQKAR